MLILCSSQPQICVIYNRNTDRKWLRAPRTLRPSWCEGKRSHVISTFNVSPEQLDDPKQNILLRPTLPLSNPYGSYMQILRPRALLNATNSTPPPQHVDRRILWQYSLVVIPNEDAAVCTRSDDETLSPLLMVKKLPSHPFSSVSTAICRSSSALFRMSAHVAGEFSTTVDWLPASDCSKPAATA